MNRPRRILVDVSYTRTQTGNVGITRTVRRLLAELRAILSERGTAVLPIAYHSQGFRHAAYGEHADSAVRARPTHDNLTAALWRLLHGGVLRRLATACVPVPLLRWIWRAHAAWTFDRMSARETPVVFGPGDLLLLSDESWNYRVWTAVHDARLQGADAVLVCYDLIPLRYPQFCAALFTTAFGEWLNRTLGQSSAVICISKATQDDLLLYCGQTGMTVPHAAHFRLGCDLPAGGVAQPARAEVQRFLSSGAPLFLAVGTIEPRKNHRLLLETCERLWALGMDLRLVVMGRPHADCRDLIARIKSHPEQGRRLLAVFDASDEELAAAYGVCRALVLPSLAEGFGLPLVEARTRGCPVIASNLPSFAELADAGVQLFEPDDGDALQVLLAEHAATNLRCTTQPMRPFTWQDSAMQCLERISGLVQARSASPGFPFRGPVTKMP
jgi:glycosyltransferase involved in cell wall biosynthesis